MLRHGAHSESVKLTPQGYITITDMILWLNKGTNGSLITKHHINRIMAMDKKARFVLRNHAIIAVNIRMELPELLIPEYDETARGNKRFLVY